MGFKPMTELSMFLLIKLSGMFNVFDFTSIFREINYYIIFIYIKFN